MEIKPPRARLDWQNSRKRSKITVPARAHPFAKFVFAEMHRQSVTYAELEYRSNVLTSTFKAWRTDNTPGLTTMEAALGALGWTLLPAPKIDTLSAEVRERVAELAEHFRSDEEAFGAALAAAAAWPGYVAERMADLPRLARAA